MADLEMTHEKCGKMLLFCFEFENCVLATHLLATSSSGTAWSQRCAVEKTHLATMTPPALPRLSLHLSPPARWPPLDLHILFPPFKVPSVPAHPQTHHRHAARCSFSQSSWLVSVWASTAVRQFHLCLISPNQHRYVFSWKVFSWIRGGGRGVFVWVSSCPICLKKKKKNPDQLHMMFK